MTKQNSFSFFADMKGHLICSYCRKGTKIMNRKTNFTWGCGQTSGIPLDSVIMSGKKPRPYSYLSFYISSSMVFKFQIFLWKATLISLGLFFLSRFHIPQQHIWLTDDNLIHFQSLPHLKIQHIRHQEIFVGQMYEGNVKRGKRAVVGLKKLLISELKLGCQTFK